MFPQVYPSPETPCGIVGQVFDIATDPSAVGVFTGPTTMDNPGYDLLNYGTQGDPVPQFPDWLDYLLVHDNIWSMGNPPLDYIAEQPAPDLTIPSSSGFQNYFSFAPSPPPSQASTPEHQYQTLPPQEPNCRQASPFKKVGGQWSCGACRKDFRGRWECKRHIEKAGKRAICLACDKEINARDDSLRRHYYKHCRRMDLGRHSGNLGFKDAFIHV